MEFKQKEALYLVELLAAALTDKVPSLPDVGFDWDNLYELSVLQKVESMAYIGLSKVQGISDAVMDKFENEYKKEIAFEMIRHSEGRRILSAFEKNSIDCLPLKGWVIKDMYPMPAMRYMCDIDILFKKEKANDVRTVLEGLGYEAAEFGANPDVYMKKPILNIEMHKALIQDKTDHFEKSWDRAVLKEGFQHTYSMTLEDYYIFMMAHFRKHFFGSGTGVRSVCDIYVFLRENKEKLNIAYIEEKLKNSGIYDFDLKVREICNIWFEGKEGSQELYDFGIRLLFGGAFGTKETARSNYIAGELSSIEGSNLFVKKIKYILHLVFPPVKIMKEEYRYLSKYPFLLPVTWVIRGFRSAFLRRERIKNALSEVSEASEDTVGKND